ncbi:MAG: penicillin-binding protein 2 [Candidatus Nanopelagicales bacterium]|nr:penicillin-binding protein 2 [Candidatus Nanopelagicales bacterium]
MGDRPGMRLGILAVFLGALLVAVLGRLVELQLVQGADFAGAAESNRFRTLIEPAPRGLILDSKGRPLVANSASVAVVADRSQLAGQEDGGAAVLARLARLLGQDAGDLETRMIPCGTAGAASPPMCSAGGPSEPVVLAAGVEAAKVLPVAEQPEQYPGLRLGPIVDRSYPRSGVNAAHVLGYVGAVSAEDLAEQAELTALDTVGRSGLEKQYDGDLRGEAGESRVVVDAMGRALGTEYVRYARPGANLVTSINADLQQVTEAGLAQAVSAARSAGNDSAYGSAVVLDVQTGRVLALASNPDYDPSLWVGGISDKNYQSLSKNGALLDHSIQTTAPPGSVFKPFTVVAMDRQGFDLSRYYDCPAQYQVGDRTFRNFENETFGRVTLARAIEVSCNTVFYRVGDQIWRKTGGEREGPGEVDPIAGAAVDAGLGSETRIDLPGEASGVVASPASKYDLWEHRRQAWCQAARDGYPLLRRKNVRKADYFTKLDRENCRTGNLWRQGDAINAAIGQGLTAVTPIQLAVAYAALANGGDVWQPTIGRALVEEGGSVVRDVNPERAGKMKLSAKVQRLLARAMAGAVTRGTGRRAFAGFPLGRHPIAGKTGTAQVEGRQSTAWFASFAPADSPRYAVVVTVGEGGTGGEVAAPVAASIYSALFGVGRPAVFGPSGPPDSLPRVVGR